MTTIDGLGLLDYQYRGQDLREAACSTGNRRFQRVLHHLRARVGRGSRQAGGPARHGRDQRAGRQAPGDPDRAGPVGMPADPLCAHHLGRAPDRGRRAGADRTVTHERHRLVLPRRGLRDAPGHRRRRRGAASTPPWPTARRRRRLRRPPLAPATSAWRGPGASAPGVAVPPAGTARRSALATLASAEKPRPGPAPGSGRGARRCRSWPPPAPRRWPGRAGARWRSRRWRRRCARAARSTSGPSG